MNDAAPAEALVDDGHCFGCGPHSNVGLKLRFEELDDRSVVGNVTVAQPYQGWRGVVHGGIVALMLDETMAYAAAALGYLGVTGEMKMRFKKPVPTNEPLVLSGKVLWQRRNVFGIEAKVADRAGKVLAFGQGSFVSHSKLAPGQRLGHVEDGDGSA